MLDLLALGLLVFPWLLACLLLAAAGGTQGASIACSEALMPPPTKQPHQALHPTLVCLRLHNINLRDHVLPLAERGTAYERVLQQR